MAKLYFRYGAMGSSKTANAIMVEYNYHERGQNVLMLKPRLDNRDGERIVRSRSGLETKCRFVEELDDIDFYRADFERAVSEQEALWLKNGGPTDAEWESYKNYLNRCGMSDLLNIYQTVYDRYLAAK